MSAFDIARDLTNALNKSVNGAKTLAGSPTSTEQVGAITSELSAVANTLSAVANSLKSIIPPGALQTVQGSNAIINIVNLEVQITALNNALASGDTSKIIASSLDFGASVAGVIGSVPSPIAPEAKAIAITLSAASSIYKNRGDISQALQDAASKASNMFNSIGHKLSKDFIIGAMTIGNFINGIEKSISDFFTTAQKSPYRGDPLTLDLNGDGLNTVPLSTPPLLFDINATGIKNSVGWVAPTDGLLIMDRNGNGVIDSGAELFGNNTPAYATTPNGKTADGFAALAQEDTNHDGVLNLQDANWTHLEVWQDLNQDGISQTNELTTLDQQGIASFNVNRTRHSQTLPNGNQIADLGSYTRTDGSSGSDGTPAGIPDINLAVDTFHRSFVDSIPLTAATQALPDMQGSGMVRDLREAANLWAANEAGFEIRSSA